MSDDVSRAMKPRFKMERRGNQWCVLSRMGRTVYADTCYAKVAGVFDFITEWSGMKGAGAVDAAPNAPTTHGSGDEQ